MDKHDPYEQWAENESTLGTHGTIGDLDYEVIRLTPENRHAFLQIVLSQYLSDPCRFCGKRYETTADLKDTIWDGEHPMHKECFEQLKQLPEDERRARGFKF